MIRWGLRILAHLLQLLSTLLYATQVYRVQRAVSELDGTQFAGSTAFPLVMFGIFRDFGIDPDLPLVTLQATVEIFNDHIIEQLRFELFKWGVVYVLVLAFAQLLLWLWFISTPGMQPIVATHQPPRPPTNQPRRPS